MVIDAGDAFAEIVGLDNGVVAAAELPVDLVEGVGVEDHSADDAISRGGLDDKFGSAKVKVGV